MGRRLGWRAGDGVLIFRRQIADRTVLGPQLIEFRLWRGGFHHGAAALDLLFSADFSVGRGVHARVYLSVGIALWTCASAPLSSYNTARSTDAVQFDL